MTLSFTMDTTSLHDLVCLARINAALNGEPLPSFRKPVPEEREEIEPAGGVTQPEAIGEEVIEAFEPAQDSQTANGEETNDDYQTTSPEADAPKELEQKGLCAKPLLPPLASDTESPVAPVSIDATATPAPPLGPPAPSAPVEEATPEEWRSAFSAKREELGLEQGMENEAHRPAFINFVHKLSESYGDSKPSKLDKRKLWRFLQEFRSISFDGKGFTVNFQPF